MTKFYSLEAYGDTVYAEANDEQDALEQLRNFAGWMPRDIIEVTEIDGIPEGHSPLFYEGPQFGSEDGDTQTEG